VARIEPIPMEEAEGKARELLDELVGRGGEPGPMVRAMANAPALLRGYLELTRAMKRSHIDRRITERINLAVHEWLSCDYCLVAHTRAARRLGVPESEIELARQGTFERPGDCGDRRVRPAGPCRAGRDWRRRRRARAGTRLPRRANRGGAGSRWAAAPDRRLQPNRGHSRAGGGARGDRATRRR
jgi:AhpD family alkylhydroperoxidase